MCSKLIDRAPLIWFAFRSLYDTTYLFVILTIIFRVWNLRCYLFEAIDTASLVWFALRHEIVCYSGCYSSGKCSKYRQRVFDLLCLRYKHLTIILRIRAEYHLILSRRGRRPSWLNQGIFHKIEQDNCFIIQQIPIDYHFQNEKNYGSVMKTLKASNT